MKIYILCHLSTHPVVYQSFVYDSTQSIDFLLESDTLAAECMRLFIAIEIPDQIKNNLIRGFRSLDLFDNRFRVVSANALHVTVKFIGEIAASYMPDIISVLTSAASQTAGGGVLTIEHCLLLPHHRPTIAGVACAADRNIYALHDLLDQLLAEHAMVKRDNRPFNPHITLARSKYATISEDDRRILNAWTPEHDTWRAASLSLIESVLKPNGPQYTTCYNQKLLP